jgi:ribonucleoside-diphosphate reductase alpha chain
VRVQAAIQKYVDASISKTVNAPITHTVEDVKRTYTLAYELGLKGIAYMREGSRQGVLERKEEEKKEEAPKVAPVAVQPRPMVVQGATYKINTPVGTAFITVNTTENGDPLEIFINVGKAGTDVYAMATGLGRVISLALRFNSLLTPRERVKEIIDQLQGIGGARTLGFGKERIRSLPDAVAKILSMHFKFNGHAEKHVQEALQSEPTLVNVESQPTLMQAQVAEEKSHIQMYDLCPSCGEASLAHEEGCSKCYGCGYAAC